MGDLLTSISILVVLITFGIGYLERRSSDRRRRTLDFLKAIIEDEGPIHKANLEFALWISNDKVFENDKLDADDDKIVVKLLDYYDLIADTAIRNVLDKEIIILHLGGRMRSAYKMLKNYIHARRETLGRPGLYTPFETFVKVEIGDRDV